MYVVSCISSSSFGVLILTGQNRFFSNVSGFKCPNVAVVSPLRQMVDCRGGGREEGDPPSACVRGVFFLKHKRIAACAG